MSTISNKTFNILYGWAEGPWHGRQLIAALEVQGFRPAPASDAAVIITHSASCYLLTPQPRNKLLLLIDPPYWPGKSIIFRCFQKVWRDFWFSLYRHEFFYWLQKTFWNIVYLLGYPLRNLQMIGASFRVLPKSSHLTSAIIIRNQDDVFCSPEIIHQINRQQLFTLPGQHDDCWHSPKPYIEIIRSAHS